MPVARTTVDGLRTLLDEYARGSASRSDERLERLLRVVFPRSTAAELELVAQRLPDIVAGWTVPSKVGEGEYVFGDVRVHASERLPIRDGLPPPMCRYSERTPDGPIREGGRHPVSASMTVYRS
ncbi:MAG: hypothetical protein CMI16_07300 [Opitutaceae bacterium]|nr:hypothetical protein [Opitutaceae bacterium]